jgi:hypothetical protein
MVPKIIIPLDYHHRETELITNCYKINVFSALTSFNFTRWGTSTDLNHAVVT